MMLWRRPSESDIRRFIADQTVRPFSYAEVGATATRPPADAAVDHNRLLVGRGEQAFGRAVEAMRAWRMFAIDGVELCWPDAPIEAGTTVAILAHAGMVWSLNACRIVYVVDRPDRFGFAYGTLPAHAVRGEERFLVERDRAGDVSYDLLAFSRPSSPALALARPLLRAAQRRFASASKRAMRRAVAGA